MEQVGDKNAIEIDRCISFEYSLVAFAFAASYFQCSIHVCYNEWYQLLVPT